MSKFTGRLRKQQYPFLEEAVDIAKYNTRKIRHIFHEPSIELQALIINLAHHKMCAVKAVCKCLSRPKMKQALQTLTKAGYIQLALNHYHNPAGTGRARVYERTALFENTFKFRLPKRIVVTAKALSKPTSQPNNQPNSPNTTNKLAHPPNVAASISGGALAVVNPCQRKTPIELIPQLAVYSRLVEPVTLSVSNGGQVFSQIDICRVDGARLYQYGSHHYQSLPKTERKYLLIDGQPTIELDYANLHINLLLNKAGVSDTRDSYHMVLRALKIRKTKRTRRALKTIFLVAINTNAINGFCSYVGRMDEYKNCFKGIVRPREIYESFITVYPALKPSLCTGKQGFNLQITDSEIMIDILETLARKCGVGLPIHDSVIVPRQYEELAKQVMLDQYKQHTGFTINVK